jgi:uncharacterized Zn finger protein
MNTNSTPAAATVNTLARKWAKAHPESASRIQRAVALVGNVERTGSHTFAVEGSEGHRYTVWVNWQKKTSTCTCGDSMGRHAHCKHRWAAALLIGGNATERKAAKA